MSLSVQRLAIELFSFRGKNVLYVHVPGMGECLVGIDVSRAIGYADDNNGKRAIKRHVPQKYMMRFEDVKDTVERHVQSDVPQDDTILLKDSGIYCFLLRCKMSKAKLFMVWVVETVLLREVRKLAWAIEEKDTTITLLTDDSRALEFRNEKHQQKILRRNKEIDDLIKNRNVPRRGYFGNVLCFIKKNGKETLPYYVIQCQYRQLKKYKKCLKPRYSKMEEAGRCDDPNAIHRWDIFKSEVIEKPNYYQNNFILTE